MRLNDIKFDQIGRDIEHHVELEQRDLEDLFEEAKRARKAEKEWKDRALELEKWSE